MLKIITSCPTSNDPPFLPSSLLPPQTLTWDDLPTYLGDVLPLSVETPGSDCVWSPPPRTGRIARACGEGGPESLFRFFHILRNPSKHFGHSTWRKDAKKYKRVTVTLLSNREASRLQAWETVDTKWIRPWANTIFFFEPIHCNLFLCLWLCPWIPDPRGKIDAT